MVTDRMAKGVKGKRAQCRATPILQEYTRFSSGLHSKTTKGVWVPEYIVRHRWKLPSACFQPDVAQDRIQRYRVEFVETGAWVKSHLAK